MGRAETENNIVLRRGDIDSCGRSRGAGIQSRGDRSPGHGQAGTMHGDEWGNICHWIQWRCGDIQNDGMGTSRGTTMAKAEAGTPKTFAKSSGDPAFLSMPGMHPPLGNVYLPAILSSDRVLVMGGPLFSYLLTDAP